MMTKQFRQLTSICLILAFSAASALAGAAALPNVLTPAQAKDLTAKDYPTTSFAVLRTFPYDDAHPSTGPTPEAKIPAEVRALNGKNVSIRGYMVPVDFESEGITHFVLVPFTDLCCFGVMTGPNEWVDVEMTAKKKVPFSAWDQILVFGKLDVKEVVHQGAVESIYKMQAESISILKAESR